MRSQRQLTELTQAYNTGFENGRHDASTPPAVPYKPNAAMSGSFSIPEDALRFIFAGNAYFTVRSLRTGTRYTFRVSRANCSRCNKTDCKCWNFPTFFVSLLAGPENSEDYVYVGMIRDNVLRTTRASKLREDSVPFKAFRWVLQHLLINEMPRETELWHDGRCGRCGRHLTVPESVAAGLGPECAGKV